MIRTFGDDVKNGVMTIDAANEEQNQFAQKVNIKPGHPYMTKEKFDVMKNANTLLKGRIMVCSHFESGIFS